MYTNYTAEDILESASLFVQHLQDTGEEVKGRCAALEEQERCLGVKSQSLEQEVLQAENLISDGYRKQEQFITNLNEHKKHIEGLESKVMKIKELQLQKEHECSNLEHNVSGLRDKIKSHSDASNNYNKQRDIILAYKLLTNIKFIYTTKKVKGLVIKELPKTFDLNPKELSQEEITKTLWDLILEE